MTDKELTDKYKKEHEKLLEEIKKKEDENMITIKVVVTTRCSANEEKEEAEKEFDFVEDYLSKTTDPVLRWYREHRKKE